jgi:hypothetical protein
VGKGNINGRAETYYIPIAAYINIKSHNKAAEFIKRKISALVFDTIANILIEFLVGSKTTEKVFSL